MKFKVGDVPVTLRSDSEEIHIDAVGSVDPESLREASRVGRELLSRVGDIEAATEGPEAPPLPENKRPRVELDIAKTPAKMETVPVVEDAPAKEPPQSTKKLQVIPKSAGGRPRKEYRTEVMARVTSFIKMADSSVYPSDDMIKEFNLFAVNEARRQCDQPRISYFPYQKLKDRFSANDALCDSFRRFFTGGDQIKSLDEMLSTIGEIDLSEEDMQALVENVTDTYIDVMKEKVLPLISES